MKTFNLFCIFLLTGCGNIYLNAPADSHVKLLPADAPAEVRVEKKVWYKWWGKYPINEEEPHAASIIEQEKLQEARIRMTNTFIDGIITIFSGAVGFPRRTLIVEGNRTRTSATKPMPLDNRNTNSVNSAGSLSAAQQLQQHSRFKEKVD